jgi:protocatechuate 3,4-dioxygenase beta subunit
MDSPFMVGAHRRRRQFGQTAFYVLISGNINMVNLVTIVTFVGAVLHAVQAHAPEPLGALQRRQLFQAREQCSQTIHCKLASEAMEGPFYVEQPLIRSNITENQPGILLNLNISVLDVNTCGPVSGVFVDIWHCDGIGVYSGWASKELLSPLSHGQLKSRGIPVDETRWLRGVQPTDANGIANFLTIFPGWYQGRATHIHLRVHTGNISLDHGVFLGSSNTSHTGQLFFADVLVKKIAATREPYHTHSKTLSPKPNEDDGIYRDSNGGEQLVSITENGDSFEGAVTVGIDSTADRPPSGPPHGPPGRRPPPGHRPPPEDRPPHSPPYGQPSFRRNWGWAFLVLLFSIPAFWAVSRLLLRSRNDYRHLESAPDQTADTSEESSQDPNEMEDRPQEHDNPPWAISRTQEMQSVGNHKPASYGAIA